jgi:cytochrome bd-type quinol oxidase subunit 1
MGRDTWRFAQHERERELKKRRNPIWRGVGCVLLVLLAMTGYFVSGWFFTENARQQWIYLPPGIMTIPFAPWIPRGVVAQLFVAMIVVLFGYAILSFVYAIMFPIRPGETDSRPLKRSGPRRR